MTQQQRDAVAGMLRASPFDPAGDLREQRPLFEKMVAAAPVPADVVTTPGQLSGVPVIHVGIPGNTTDGVIVYFHGGFFAIGSAAASVGLAADLARQARMQVVTVDYRLAPEHPYPAAPHDAMTAYRALLDGGQDVARLALAGESAGATLAVVTLAAIQRAGLPPPASAVLMSPWADLAGTGDSSVGTWAPILAGVVLLAGFVACEWRSAHPLIELGLFRNGHVVWGTVQGPAPATGSRRGGSRCSASESASRSPRPLTRRSAPCRQSGQAQAPASCRRCARSAARSAWPCSAPSCRPATAATPRPVTFPRRSPALCTTASRSASPSPGSSTTPI